MYLGRAGAADRGANGGCEADRCGGSYGRAHHRGRWSNYGTRGADYSGGADGRGGGQTCQC